MSNSGYNSYSVSVQRKRQDSPQSAPRTQRAKIVCTSPRKPRRYAIRKALSSVSETGISYASSGRNAEKRQSSAVSAISAVNDRLTRGAMHLSDEVEKP
jgi:hypothetical protein